MCPRDRSALAAAFVFLSAAAPADGRDPAPQAVIELPAPDFEGAPLEDALRERRSVREYADEPLSLAQVSQLLWAGQGITRQSGYRTAPSAGALYPLEIHILVGRVQGLAPGNYRYAASRNALELVTAGDSRRELAMSALRQMWIGEAPAVIAITAVPERTAKKYGGRATRYVHIEAGHAAQNMCLQAVSLGLGATVVGAFHDAEVAQLLGLPDGEIPVLLLPVGPPQGS